MRFNFNFFQEYKTSDGVIIDLLQKSGVKEHANRYVTSLMDIVFKPEELLAIETKDMPKDERYIMMKGLYIFTCHVLC